LVWLSQLAASSSEGCWPNGLTIHSQTCWNIVSYMVDELSNVFLVVVGHYNPDLWYLELCIVTVGSHLRESPDRVVSQVKTKWSKWASWTKYLPKRMNMIGPKRCMRYNDMRNAAWVIMEECIIDGNIFQNLLIFQQSSPSTVSKKIIQCK